MAAGTGALILPVPIVLGADPGEGAVTLPMFVVSGASGAIVNNTFELTTPVISGTGEVRTEASTDISVPLITISATGLSGTLGTGAFILPVPIIGVESGPIGTGSVVLPQFVVRVVPQTYFTLPSITVDGFGRLLPISKVYKGVVMNIANQAVSTYSNYPFNSMGFWQGRYLGATSDGIYVLDGDRDNGTRINAKLKTGPINFGDGVIKYLRSAWVTFRSEGHITLVLEVDEDEDNPIELQPTTKVGNELTEERLKCPRGLRGRFYTVELKNLSGADFDLDSLSILVEAIRRKVR